MYMYVIAQVKKILSSTTKKVRGNFSARGTVQDKKESPIDSRKTGPPALSANCQISQK